MKRFLIFSLFFICFSVNTFSQNMTGKKLLEKSIKYHDPKGKWEKGKFTFNLKKLFKNALFDI